MISNLFDLEAAGPSPPPFTVLEETAWRIPPGSMEERLTCQRVIASRWRGPGPAAGLHCGSERADYHTVAINLQEVVTTLKRADNILHEGPLAAGMVQLTAPGEDLRIEVQGAHDWLHIYVSNGLLARCLRPKRHRSARRITLLRRTPILDPVLEGLARALLNVSDTCDAYSHLYANGINMALLSRLISVHSAFALPVEDNWTSALVRWRLRRAIEYMEDHIADPITLADIAAAVGLTRMHFAAQFRAATGLRPREFFLKKRVEHAKHLLLGSTYTLVDIAFATGFQTQAHFTTVFKRFVSATPHQWRCENRHAPSSASRVSDLQRCR